VSLFYFSDDANDSTIKKKSPSGSSGIEQSRKHELPSRLRQRVNMLDFYLLFGLQVIMNSIEEAASLFRVMNIDQENTTDFEGTSLKRILIPPANMKAATRFMWNLSVDQIPQARKRFYKALIKTFFDFSKKGMSEQEKRKAGSLNLHLFQEGIERGSHPHHAPIYTRIVSDMGSAYFWRYVVKKTAPTKKGPDSDLVDENLVRLRTGDTILMADRNDAHQASIVGLPGRNVQVATVSYFGQLFSDPHSEVPDVSGNDYSEDPGLAVACLREYRPHYEQYWERAVSG